MTLPNKLTLSRLALTPVYFLLFFISIKNQFYPTTGIIILWILFITMEITDLLDGYIARSKTLVSDVGKLLDPFADVIARITYFLCFYSMGIMPLWALMIVLWREYSIGFIRTLVAKEGVALGASIWGKMKSLTYFLSVFLSHIIITADIFLGDYASEAIINKALYLVFLLVALSSFLSFMLYLKNYQGTETHKNFISE